MSPSEALQILEDAFQPKTMVGHPYPARAIIERALCVLAAFVAAHAVRECGVGPVHDLSLPQENITPI